MRIALVSTGLGRVQRGFEAFTESLFQALRQRAPELAVTLFQSASSVEGRVVVPNFHRADVPARWFDDMTAGYWEKRSFALALYPRLRFGGYNIVHYNELTMGSALFHLRRFLGGEFKLLYCNGAPSPPLHYNHRCDFAQVLTGPQYSEARAFGMPDERLFRLPYGIDADLFNPDQKLNRVRIRHELGVPSDANLILSVAAVKREHKRIHHLLQEAALLPKDTWVVVAGQVTDDTAYLESMAEKSVPGRWRFVSWPHARVAKLYGAADAFVLCSMTEGLPLATVEAMLSELPVIIHNGPIFEWLAQDTSVRMIDMAAPGKLAMALIESLQRRASSEQVRDLSRTREVARKRFSWEELVPHYIDMYRVAVGEGETPQPELKRIFGAT